MFFNRQSLFLYFVLALSVGYLVSALSIGPPIIDGGLTPSFFPIFLGIAAILFSSTLVLQNLRSRSDETGSREPAIYTHLWVIAAIFVYITAFRPLGYFISSLLFVFAILVIFSSLEKMLQKAAISVAIVGIAYVMFQQLFGVRLPSPWG